VPAEECRFAILIQRLPTSSARDRKKRIDHDAGACPYSTWCAEPQAHGGAPVGVRAGIAVAEGVCTGGWAWAVVPRHRRSRDSSASGAVVLAGVWGALCDRTMRSSRYRRGQCQAACPHPNRRRVGRASPGKIETQRQIRRRTLIKASRPCFSISVEGSSRLAEDGRYPSDSPLSHCAAFFGKPGRCTRTMQNR
jgi:hypothetical protein